MSASGRDCRAFDVVEDVAASLGRDPVCAAKRHGPLARCHGDAREIHAVVNARDAPRWEQINSSETAMVVIADADDPRHNA